MYQCHFSELDAPVLPNQHGMEQPMMLTVKAYGRQFKLKKDKTYQQT